MPMVRCEKGHQYFVEAFDSGECFICKYTKEQKKKSLSRVAQERRDARKQRRR